MRSLRSSLPRLVAAFFTGAPAVVLVLMLAGLYGADRVLLENERARIRTDISDVTARIEKFIGIHGAVLGSFHALFARPRGVTDSTQFRFLLDLAATEARGLRRVWVSDASGAVVQDGSPGASQIVAPDVADSLRRRLIEAARRTRRDQVSGKVMISPEMPGFIMASPVVLEDSIAGFVLGAVSSIGVRSSLGAQDAPSSRRAVIITVLPDSTSGVPDTIDAVIDSAGSRAVREEHTVVPLPGGRQWQVDVTHAATGWPARLALWGIGLAALSTLAIGTVRERQQSRRIAERSHELEHLSTELLHANRAKSEFLANVSHELRTPLNAIVGFVELLRDGVYGELAPRQIGPVERIAASGNHLRHLVDQVLDLAKITAGRLEVHTDVVDLRSFVLDVASEMESLITERGLSLSIAVGATLPRLRTDPTHLRQILVNLVGNAIKYTNLGTVSIRARLVNSPVEDTAPRATPDSVWLQPLTPPGDGTWIALQVIDTGIGIAESDQDRIFDEFEQVGAGPRGDSMQRGTGLGLSISRRLAQLIGGEITVESQLGKGSTFTLWLRVDPADLQTGGGRRSSARTQVADEPS